MTTNTVVNVSAVEADGVEVYWSMDCRERVSSIDWETLHPGSMKSNVVYLRNEGEEPIYVLVVTRGWNPARASEYITLGWDYMGQRLDPDEIIRMTLTLSVSYFVKGVSSFTFEILMVGKASLPGDVNENGIVNVADALMMALAFGSQLGDPNWNPDVDLSQDGIVNNYDILIIANNFGKDVCTHANGIDADF